MKGTSMSTDKHQPEDEKKNNQPSQTEQEKLEETKKQQADTPAVPVPEDGKVNHDIPAPLLEESLEVNEETLSEDEDEDEELDASTEKLASVAKIKQEQEDKTELIQLNSQSKSEDEDKSTLPTTFLPDVIEQEQEDKTVLLPSNGSSESEKQPEYASLIPIAETIPLLEPQNTPKAVALTPPTVYGGVAVLRTPRQRQIMLRRLSRRNLREARFTHRRNFRRFWLGVLMTIMLLLFVFFSLTGAGSFVAYQFYSQTQSQFTPKVINLRDWMPKDNLKMYDSKGILIGQLANQGIHTSVSLNDVSKNLVNATVSIEDKNFWTNPGLDINRIFQSAISDIANGHTVEGGSTITQQLIKNLVVGNQGTIQRKLQEAVLTPLVNDHYSKNDIMEMYVNDIYYGEQAYGIDSAATLYFGIEDQPGKPAAKNLDLAQSAMLAGIPNSPYAFDPILHPKAALARMKVVLDSMVSNKYITEAQEIDAYKEAQGADFYKHPESMTNRAPHFFNFVLSQLETAFHLSYKDLSRSDMKVHTTLDVDLQDKIQKIAQQHIAALQGLNVTNSAEVLIDFHTGAILSLLGSIDYNNTSIDGQYDVATQGYRQPGSSFKPYVYVTAFEQGASPAQAIKDTRLAIPQPGANPPYYSPLNYDRLFHGDMTLRCALQNSLNIPAVKVLQHVGIDSAMKTAQDMGIDSYNGTPGLSLVLGGLGVHLLDHTSAYGTFANGGVHVPYYAIQKVEFVNAHRTYNHPNDPGKQVISPQLAYMMTNVLSDNGSRLPEFFDCNVLQLYSNSRQDCFAGNRGAIRPAAAKTGTTNDFRDNWTMGYTTDYVMGVWTGNNDNSPMGGALGITGVDGAAPIWHDSLQVAEEGHPINDFVNPGGLERATVTYPDGVHTTDWFIPGTVPGYGAQTNTNQGTPDIMSNLQDDNNNSSLAAAAGGPYCPSSFSFASASKGSSNRGVW